MRIALDTNILSAILSGEPTSRGIVSRLSQARQDGDVLVICGLVYVELLAYPNITRELRDDFLADTELVVELDLSRDVWELAGEAYLRHAHQGRRSQTAFLIGAHAKTRADCLFTLDKSLSRFFPDLRLLATMS